MCIVAVLPEIHFHNLDWVNLFVLITFLCHDIGTSIHKIDQLQSKNPLITFGKCNEPLRSNSIVW